MFLLMLTALGAQPGCGLFSIRNPVAPDTRTSIPRKAFIAPDSVLYNFEVAIRYRVDGLSLYGECLSDSFHLVLDPLDVADLGADGLDSLTKAQDTVAQQRLSQDFAADSLDFVFDNKLLVEKDTTATYLAIQYVLKTVPADSVVAQGQADLYLIKNQAQIWSLSRWVDKREQGTQSFGRWHAERAPQTAPGVGW